MTMVVLQPDWLKTSINKYIPDLVAMRRDLHAHPELSFEEIRTSRIVAERLHALGMEVQIGLAQTGVVGLLRGEGRQSGSSRKLLAIRADMDALPIYEQNTVEYRSLVDGKMHACGHDGHISILLTVADLLSKRRSELQGDIKFIFQPAEECVGGAKPMIEQGAMVGVDGVIGLHLTSTMPSGFVGVRTGAVYASANRFTLTIHGKGGHAALPQDAVDSVVIAAYIITTLQTLISRETSPFSPAVITIGMMQAGTAFNIIPETAVLRGTIRAFTPTQREYLLRRIAELATGIARSMGGSCGVEVTDGCPPCVNDPVMTEMVYRAAVASVGKECVKVDESVMTTWGDDMAYFLQSVPGCYFIVGAQNADKGASYPHHHPQFNIDEDALPIGVEVLTRAALDFLHS
jgi:amidohydrolase